MFCVPNPTQTQHLLILFMLNYFLFNFLENVLKMSFEETAEQYILSFYQK